MAAPLLARGASVVLTTSFLNAVGTAGLSILSATKAAVRSLAQSLGAELAPRGIRVNAVSPGPASTPFHSKLGLSADQLKEPPRELKRRFRCIVSVKPARSPRRRCFSPATTRHS